jgi:thioredoxin-dependent peroxiredoxin
MLDIGDKVPDLIGQTADGAIRLRDLRGKFVVVYFYPKDNTPGCTRQAQDLRDAHRQLARRDAVVLGVSRDSIKSHSNFTQKHALGFALVADPDETWCDAFDVIHEKVLYGKRHMGVVRSTFLIAPDGRLRRQWRGVKVPGHAAAILEALDAESA